MPIPDYQKFMLPILKLVSDGNEHLFRVLVSRLADRFQITESERKEVLPSGAQFVFENRVGWARTYLKKAGLVKSPRRGVVVITPRGLQTLQEEPSELNVSYLKRYPEFVAFQTLKRGDQSSTEQDGGGIQELDTPEEALESAYQSIRASLAQELLTRVKSMSPEFFEKLVVELLVRMGYGGSIKDAGKAVGGSGDEGIDGIIKEDKLGLGIIYIQAKRWTKSHSVGRPEIQKFVGALAGQGARKGVFITTAEFSAEAREYRPQNETKIVLIDGGELSQLMIDYDIGVTSQQLYHLKRVDGDYFGED